MFVLGSLLRGIGRQCAILFHFERFYEHPIKKLFGPVTIADLFHKYNLVEGGYSMVGVFGGFTRWAG
jgi:hypothetical protein